jgi:hypothetical protein
MLYLAIFFGLQRMTPSAIAVAAFCAFGSLKNIAREFLRLSG